MTDCKTTLRLSLLRLSLLRVLALVWMVVVLAGCAGFVDPAQGNTAQLVALDQPVGQSFVAQHAGMQGIEVFLEPRAQGEGNITLDLRASPDADTTILTATLPLGQVNAPDYYRFELSTLQDAHGQDYFFELAAEPPGAVAVGTGPGATYINGAMYQDGQPVDAQVAFRLVYDPVYIVRDLLAAAWAWIGAAAAFALLFLLPGLGLLTLAGVEGTRAPEIGWIERGAMAGGLGLSLYPLLFLWVYVAGLHLPMWVYVWLPPLCGLVVLVAANRGRRPTLRKGKAHILAWRRSPHFWADLSAISVIGLMVSLRLLVIRGLEAPLWGDSVQHAEIAQLIGDHAGLFRSWQPYAPYESMTVHFGFHAAVAVYGGLVGMPVELATTLVGQLVNVVAVVGIYGLALRLTHGDRWAGAGALLAAGLVSTLPAFFVNWGRYSQLAGQAILPAALWLLWIVFYARGVNWRAIVVAGLTVAGMALSYYRMIHYYALFVVAWLLFWGLPQWGRDVRRLAQTVLGLILMAVVAALLFAPWFVSILDSYLGEVLAGGLIRVSPWANIVADYAIWWEIGEYVRPILVVTSLAAVVWGTIKRDWSPLLVGTWALGLALLVMGRLVHLPGANAIVNFAVVIALYLPAGLLTGWLFGRIAGSIRGRYAQAGIFVATLVIAVWAARAQVTIVRTEFMMVTRPDVRAMQWIREHTPAEARFLVEGFTIDGRRSAVGADAGWWIPLLAQRANTMPPQYAMINEVPAEPGYSQKVTGLVATLEDNPIGAPVSLQALCEWGVTHVYIGQGQGQVGKGVTQLFTPEELQASPAFEPVYREDRVQIYALKRDACDAVEL